MALRAQVARLGAHALGTGRTQIWGQTGAPTWGAVLANNSCCGVTRGWYPRQPAVASFGLASVCRSVARSRILGSSVELFFFPSNVIPLVQGFLITTKHSQRDGAPHEKLEGIGGATHSTLGVGGGYTWCQETHRHRYHYSLCNLRNLNIFLLTEISQWRTTEPSVHSSWLKDCINVPAGRRRRPTYQHAVRAEKQLRMGFAMNSRGSCHGKPTKRRRV